MKGNTMQKRLFRSKQDRMLAGVCGGLAEYFDIDPTIVRLLFVVGVLAGVSPVVYVLMWIVMPEEAGIPTATTPVAPVTPAATPPYNGPTGEWRYDPYTGERLQK